AGLGRAAGPPCSRRTGRTARTPRQSDSCAPNRRSSVRRLDLAIGIGGAAGQGIATPGDVLARIFVRRGLHVNAYNAYQSIIRGGHIFLTLRTSDEPVLSYGDKLDVLMPLNQDTMNRHLRLMRAGSAVLFNSDAIKPGD